MRRARNLVRIDILNKVRHEFRNLILKILLPIFFIIFLIFPSHISVHRQISCV